MSTKKPTPEQLDRAVAITHRVWQYIGGDCGDVNSNGEAIELCLDADRPATCYSGPTTKEQAAEDQAFLRTLYTEFTFAGVARAIGKSVRFV
jgi:hypothetical protein